MAWKPGWLARLGMLNQRWESNLHPFCPRTHSASVREVSRWSPCPGVTSAFKELVIIPCLSHLLPSSRQIVLLNYHGCLWLGSCMLPHYWCFPPRPCCGSELFFWELRLCFADLSFFQTTDHNSMWLFLSQTLKRGRFLPASSWCSLSGGCWVGDEARLHLYGIEETATWCCTWLMLSFTVIWKYNRSLFEICFITFLCIPD